MSSLKIFFRKVFPLIITITTIIFCILQIVMAQNGGELRWVRIGSLHSFYSEQAGEVEACRRSTGPVEDGMIWPAEYGDRQSSMAQRAMWLGCTDFYDTKLETTFPYKVVGVGPRSSPSDRPDQVMESELKLIGKSLHPVVIVDGLIATDNEFNDILDEDPDPNLPCDRMIVNIVNTSIGITVTRKIMAFSHPNHDNYFIYDFTFRNTGIIDRQGTIVQDSLTGCVFYFLYRYSFAGESVEDFNNRWSPWNASWGRNCVNQVIFEDPDYPGTTMRAHYAWYGPHSERSVPLEDDWGLPNEEEDGVMAAARFAGCITLHADGSASNPLDDSSQPMNTWYLGSDDRTTQSYSQYDAILMADKYGEMRPQVDVPQRPGHPDQTHAEQVGDGAANEWGDDAGGYSQGQGFGPYNLAFGDSIHIVVAEGVSGISRAKNREVGGNWFEYYTRAGTPTLIMPDGSTTTDAAAYKKAWVLTCEDSILQTLRNAARMYQYLYEDGDAIADSPPPPDEFIVESGGDRIKLSWSNNAEDPDLYPHFDGYQIYRSEGTVMNPKTQYVKIFECNKADAVNSYDDMTARRGFDYYYYIQTKSDGSDNDLHPGVPLVSSKFSTLTNTPANLRRIAGDELEDIRVVPNPYVKSVRKYQFGERSQYDQIAFYGIPPYCEIKIYTERGDLIWEKVHDNGSGDELWNSLTTYGQVVASGVYIAYFKVIQDYTDPNTGKQLFKGQSTYRKFIVIR
jgi:hypothetical protein